MSRLSQLWTGPYVSLLRPFVYSYWPGQVLNLAPSDGKLSLALPAALPSLLPSRHLPWFVCPEIHGTLTTLSKQRNPGMKGGLEFIGHPHGVVCNEEGKQSCNQCFHKRWERDNYSPHGAQKSREGAFLCHSFYSISLFLILQAAGLGSFTAGRALCAWAALPAALDKPRRLQLFSALKMNSSVVEGGKQTKHRCFGTEAAGTVLSWDAFSSSNLLMPSCGVSREHRSGNNFAYTSQMPPACIFLHHTSPTPLGLLTASKHFAPVQTFCYFWFCLFICLIVVLWKIS